MKLLMELFSKKTALQVKLSCAKQTHSTQASKKDDLNMRMLARESNLK
jgi:hypothetical protein